MAAAKCSRKDGTKPCRRKVVSEVEGEPACDVHRKRYERGLRGAELDAPVRGAHGKRPDTKDLVVISTRVHKRVRDNMRKAARAAGARSLFAFHGEHLSQQFSAR